MQRIRCRYLRVKVVIARLPKRTVETVETSAPSTRPPQLMSGKMQSVHIAMREHHFYVNFVYFFYARARATQCVVVTLDGLWHGPNRQIAGSIWRYLREGRATKVIKKMSLFMLLFSRKSLTCATRTTRMERQSANLHAIAIKRCVDKTFILVFYLDIFPGRRWCTRWQRQRWYDDRFAHLVFVYLCVSSSHNR